MCVCECVSVSVSVRVCVCVCLSLCVQVSGEGGQQPLFSAVSPHYPEAKTAVARPQFPSTLDMSAGTLNHVLISTGVFASAARLYEPGSLLPEEQHSAPELTLEYSRAPPRRIQAPPTAVCGARCAAGAGRQAWVTAGRGVTTLPARVADGNQTGRDR